MDSSVASKGKKRLADSPVANVGNIAQLNLGPKLVIMVDVLIEEVLSLPKINWFLNPRCP